MIKHFFNLQWKSFFRSASFQTDMALKILMAFGMLWMIVSFLGMGALAYVLIEEQGYEDPLLFINSFLIYFLLFDLVLRYFMQKMPIVNIKPLLYLPFKKSQVVNITLASTALSFFNWMYAFFFIPFSVVLLVNGYDPIGVIGWHLGIMAIVYFNNFLNILVNNKDGLFYGIISVLLILGCCQYYGFFDVTTFTTPFFHGLYTTPFLAISAWIALVIVYYMAFSYFKKHMYLDAGLSVKQAEAKTEDLDWLNKFGNLGTFLKNDIKLIKRNKRSKTTVLVSFLFLFYGLLFFSGSIESYDNPIMKVFAGIFVSGGFLFTFGQYVPSWDSAYYPLMMSQNIAYKEYLNSKWYLIVIATTVSALLGSGYLYFGWEAYMAVFVGAIYNIGVNSYLVLWGGAYIKTPVDLSSNKKAFGDKQAFNAKTLLLTLPKLLLPMAIYGLGHYLVNPTTGFIALAIAGISGFAFKNWAFKKIEAVYKKEKYKTLAAYKQTK